MASLTLRFLSFTVLYLLWVDATPISDPAFDPVPECTPWCEDDCIPVEVKKIEDEVCACGRVMLGYPGNSRYMNRLWVEKTQNNAMEIRWKLEIQPKSGSSVLYLPRDNGDVCFNITTTKVPSWADNVKINCTRTDHIDIKDHMFKLIDMNRFDNLATWKSPRSRRRKGKTKKKFKRRGLMKKRYSGTCDCWKPEVVSIEEVDNTTLAVSWTPFYALSDVRVRLVEKGIGDTDDRNDKILPTPYLCQDFINRYTFHNLTPATYVAQVGSFGCDCIEYRLSDPFQLSVPETTTVGRSTTFTNTPSTSAPDDDSTLQQIALTVVGILAFIGCTSLGLVCLNQRGAVRFFSWKYHPVSARSPKDPYAKPKITVLEGNQDKAATEIATWIKNQLIQPNTEVALAKPDKLKNDVGVKDLLVFVSLQDIQTFQGFLVDQSLSKKTITVLMDYARDTVTDKKCPLVVHVPAEINARWFSTMNNESKQMQILELEAALQCLNPKWDLCSPDVATFLEKTRDFAENRRNEFRHIFIISGCDHPLHNEACLELTRLLRKLDKNVIYVFEETNRKEMQKGFSAWTINQINSADLIIIVGSEVLYKLVNGFENERDLPNNLQNQAICAPLALKLLSNKTWKAKVAYVSFGYGSKYIESIIKRYPLLNSDMRYDLVESRECAFGEDVEDGEYVFNESRSRALGHFFSRLTADQKLVKEAANDSLIFFKKVEEMAAMMANDSDWLKTIYGSVESLGSLMTISERSVIFRHGGYGIAFGSENQSGNHQTVPF